MDDLYTPLKFAKEVLDESGDIFMVHGVCHPTQCIPKCLVQGVVTKKYGILRSENIVKYVRLSDSKCEHLFAMSFYDSKPVYHISNASWIRR